MGEGEDEDEEDGGWEEEDGEGSSGGEPTQGGFMDGRGSEDGGTPFDNCHQGLSSLSLPKGARYGLTSIGSKRERVACLSNIAIDMRLFEDWSKSVYRVGRPKELRQQSTETFESQKQRVHAHAKPTHLQRAHRMQDRSF